MKLLSRCFIVADMVHLPSSYNYLLLLCILASRFPAVTGLFEWLRQNEEDPPGETAAAPSLPPPPPPPPPADSDPSILAENVRFEMATADEKFLAEAKQMELSPLDGCHHKVSGYLALDSKLSTMKTRFSEHLAPLLTGSKKKKKWKLC